MSSMTPIVLAPLSAVYGAVTEARLALYRRGLLRVSQLAAPVISVGNITTGGTGKTPIVEFVAGALARKHQRICVLTRGYGRQKSGQRVLVSDGERVLANAQEAGDEPRLLAERLLGISAVISDADRFAAGEWAIKNLGSEVFVLDDGFQHLCLARNLDMVAIDATAPWGQGHFLPWGRLREPARGLSRADCVVITRADQSDGVLALREEIHRLAPVKPVFTSHMGIRGFKPLNEKLAENRAYLPDKIAHISQPVAAFCGIGNPTSFVSLLKSSGCDPVSITKFPDHYRYNGNDIANIVEKAKAAGARSLVTTAKDAVKFHDFSFALACYVLEIELRIDDEPQFLELIHSAVIRETR